MTSATRPRRLGRRYFVMVLLFAQIVINYIDRVNLSIAAPAISKHFHWDAATMGWVFSAYMWTYILFQVPSGLLVDRFGVRRVASVVVPFWSFATVCTGAVGGFATMVLARLGLGMGEAAIFPLSNKVVRQWFPAEERAFATSIYHSGMAIAKVSTPLIALVILRFGWRWAFVVTGIPGLLWVVAWIKWFRQPEKCSWLSEEERKFILETRQGDSGAATAMAGAVRKPAAAASSVNHLLCQRSVWGVCLTQGCMNYTNFIFVAWLPMFLMSRGMNLMKAGILTAVPNLVAAGMEIALARLSDKLLTPELARAGKRRLHVATLLASMVLILVLSQLDNEWLIVGVICVVMGCTAAVGALNSALTNDLIQEQQIAGTTFGMLHFVSGCFGAAGPVVTGYIVKYTHSFNDAYIPAAGLALLGAVIAMTMTRHPISAAGRFQAGAAAAGQSLG